MYTNKPRFSVLSRRVLCRTQTGALSDRRMRAFIATPMLAIAENYGTFLSGELPSTTITHQNSYISGSYTGENLRC